MTGSANTLLRIDEVTLPTMIAHIGIDESGKGDYFGPLVIAACYVADWHLAELEGVKDSKKVTDRAAFQLSNTIKATCPHSIVAIGPEKYNELYERHKNLNKILSWGHAQSIENVLKIQECEMALSDQFGDPSTIVWLLKQKGLTIKLESRVRAEEDIAVAAASILARAEFLRRLERLGVDAGVVLPKGASNAVIETGKKLVSARGEACLKQFAKVHFRTTQSVLGQAV